MERGNERCPGPKPEAKAYRIRPDLSATALALIDCKSRNSDHQLRGDRSLELSARQDVQSFRLLGCDRRTFETGSEREVVAGCLRAVDDDLHCGLRRKVRADGCQVCRILHLGWKSTDSKCCARLRRKRPPGKGVLPPLDEKSPGLHLIDWLATTPRHKRVGTGCLERMVAYSGDHISEAARLVPVGS